MYIKLKNPIKTQLSQQFFFSCLIAFGLIGFFVVAGFIYGTPLGGFYALYHLLVAMKNDDLFTFFMMLVALVIFPFIAISGIISHFKTRPLWKRKNFVYALDFQLSDVLVLSKQPVALPYNTTDCQLTIHIKKVKQGKNNYVPKVCSITLKLTDITQTAEQPLPTHFVIDHLCGLKDIFPLLDFKPLFHHFTYVLDVQNKDKETQSYRNFVEEQIKNHLNYGVHVNYTGMEITKIIFFNILVAGMLCAIFLPFLSHSPSPITWMFTLVAILCIFPFYFRLIIKPLFIHFKSSKTLKQLRNGK